MAQKTALSVLGLPGMMHSFSAKAAAIGIKAFGEFVVNIVTKFSGTMTNETKYDGDLTVEEKLDGVLTINQ